MYKEEIDFLKEKSSQANGAAFSRVLKCTSLSSQVSVLNGGRDGRGGVSGLGEPAGCMIGCFRELQYRELADS